MVRGITKQVIVVKSPDPKLFEQAIFLIKDDALEQGGITEEALLKEARQACQRGISTLPTKHKILWGILGASLTGFVWIVTLLL